jgi:hypothetical protein
MDMQTKLDIRRTALVALCALALSPAALFAENTPKTAEEYGVIKSVDNNSHQIVVTDKKAGTEGTFRWNDQTKFTEQDRTVNATALKEGMPVHLTYVAGAGPALLERVKLEPQKTPTRASVSHSTHKKP